MGDASDASWADADSVDQQEEVKEAERLDEALVESGNEEKPQRNVSYASGPPELIPSAAFPPTRVTRNKLSYATTRRTRQPSNSIEAQSTVDDSGDGKAEQKQEISSILEHLIVHGNYYRHLRWRQQQWIRSQIRDAMDVTQATTDESVVAKQDDDAVSDDDGDIDNGTLPFHKKQRMSSDHEKAIPLNKSTDVHASDARIYHNHSQEPDLWPKLPVLLARENPLSDALWKEECADQFVNTIAFSQMRLSPQASLALLSIPDTSNVVTALENATDDDEDLLYHFFERHCRPSTFDAAANVNHAQALSSREDVLKSQPEVAKSTSARVMLLRCWDRAVHAASTTLVVENRPVTKRGLLVPPALDAMTDHSNEECDTSFHDTQSDAAPKCNAETAAEWAKHQNLSLNLIQRILETEVEAQMQQLVQVVLSDAESCLHAKRQSEPSSSELHLNAFDILSMWDKRFRSSRAVWTTGAVTRETCQETLEVESHEPPILINAAVLEATRIRIVDRYAKVPR